MENIKDNIEENIKHNVIGTIRKCIHIGYSTRNNIESFVWNDIGVKIIIHIEINIRANINFNIIQKSKAVRP